MHTYRCEWRIDVSAETPEEAAKKAEELMRGAWLSCWTVIDEHGREQNVDVPALLNREASETSDEDDEFPSYPCPEDPDGLHFIGCGCEHY